MRLTEAGKERAGDVEYVACLLDQETTISCGFLCLRTVRSWGCRGSLDVARGLLKKYGDEILTNFCSSASYSFSARLFHSGGIIRITNGVFFPEGVGQLWGEGKEKFSNEKTTLAMILCEWSSPVAILNPSCNANLINI